MTLNYTSDEAARELETRAIARASIYVFEAPLRLWHWVNALAITVLMVTGYLIGRPLPSMPGDASSIFTTGYVRLIHFSAGYILAIALMGRLYWAVVGNVHARQLFRLPLTSKRWWSEVLFELKWYLFLERVPKKYVGHNPLAHLMMVSMFLTTLMFMIVTGFALYSEGAGYDSWQHALFGWVIGLVGNTERLHVLHHLGLWMMGIFVFLHVYAAIREDIMSRQNLISTIINGERAFKDDAP